MTLLELAEQQADGDLVREVLAFAADRIMEAAGETHTGAVKGARSPQRQSSGTATVTGIRARAGSRLRG